VIDYFNANPASFWFLVGFVLLAIEIVAFGFASGVLLFGSIGALITGALLWSGIVPDTWLTGVAVFTLTSMAVAVLLWKPLKSLQSSGKLGADRSSDLIGHEFRLLDTVSVTTPGTIRYSGVEWQVQLDADSAVEQLDKGSRVRVSRVSPGVFQVREA